MTRIQTLAVAATSVAAITVHAGPVVLFGDDFNDNAIGPEWQVVQDDVDLSILERNGTLSFDATGTGSNNDDALLLSNGPAGFRLSTADPFNMQIDYAFDVADASVAGDQFGLVFGVGVDLDGQDSAAIGYGAANGGIATVSGAAWGIRIDDAPSGPALPDITVAPTGTFVIDYDPTSDTLTVSANGYSEPLAGLVQGTWNADLLYVSFGARGNGFLPDEFGTTLDNFQINTGTLVAIPEPASLGLLTLGGLVLRRRR